jgi:aminoglycoside 6'-N-acetyltransferase
MTADVGGVSADVTTAVLSFRRLRREDFPLLSHWFRAPHVEPWWREAHDLASIEERYGPAVDGVDPTELFVAELDEHPIGFLQWYCMVDNPSWLKTVEAAGVGADAAGMDYLIGDATLVGKGLGPRMIRQFLDDVLPRYPAVASIALSVGQGNRRSWRALEKLGFRRVWEGDIVSDDPSDEGPSFIYVLKVR